MTRTLFLLAALLSLAACPKSEKKAAPMPAPAQTQQDMWHGDSGLPLKLRRENPALDPGSPLHKFLKPPPGAEGTDASIQQ